MINRNRALYHCKTLRFGSSDLAEWNSNMFLICLIWFEGREKRRQAREGEMRCRCWGIRSEMRFSKVTTCISTPLADTLRHQAQPLTLRALLYPLEFTVERRRNENGREKESEIEWVCARQRRVAVFWNEKAKSPLFSPMEINFSFDVYTVSELKAQRASF